MTSSKKVHIAVEGCCHGELDKIYSLIDDARCIRGRQVDVLLVCGDFQGVRNQSDLQCLAVPVVSFLAKWCTLAIFSKLLKYICFLFLCFKNMSLFDYILPL